MKILTKEEEDGHYAAVLRGGWIGGALGLGIGLSSAMIMHKRWPFFAQLTLPFKSFYVSSVCTCTAIVAGDRASRDFNIAQHQELWIFNDRTSRAIAEAKANRTATEVALDWAREHRYPIVMASWAASMGGSLAAVSRNKYLTPAQKLVQARVYAQGLTLLVLIASAAFEVADAKSGKGRYETIHVKDEITGEDVEKRIPIHVEQYAGEDLWKDMVVGEERRLERERLKREQEARA